MFDDLHVEDLDPLEALPKTSLGDNAVDEEEPDDGRYTVGEVCVAIDRKLIVCLKNALIEINSQLITLIIITLYSYALSVVSHLHIQPSINWS